MGSNGRKQINTTSDEPLEKLPVDLSDWSLVAAARGTTQATAVATNIFRRQTHLLSYARTSFLVYHCCVGRDRERLGANKAATMCGGVLIWYWHLAMPLPCISAWHKVTTRFPQGSDNIYFER